MISERHIQRKLIEHAQKRGSQATFCPSEVARELGADWRVMMPLVRKVAAKLCSEGRLRCTRRGQPVDPEAPGGPIRLSLPMGPPWEI